MLSVEENGLISQVGPGTLMGNLMRQYWLSLATSDELEADGPQVRVRLLGENLVAFRTISGKIGLVDPFCPHRGTSLFFGRNEEEGIRCSYHAWKFDISGACIDQRGEPEENKFKSKFKVAAYPCVERGGIIWTYVGSREVPSSMPAIEANHSDGTSHVSRTLRYCNWLHALEGDIDTLHSEYLHGPAVVDISTMTPGTGMYYRHRLRAQFNYKVRETSFGTSYCAYRPAEEGTTYWRIARFLFPCFTMTPTPTAGSSQAVRMWVPLDDDHVMFWSIEASAQERSSRTHEYREDTSDWMGKHRPVQRIENDYLVDREDQKTESYTGIGGGFVIHDTMATESMGTTMDRSREHLGASYGMIIRTRKRLLDALRALEDDNIAPQVSMTPASTTHGAAGLSFPAIPIGGKDKLSDR
jgi:phthalate 4,5-dioxygenase oxygenase subunit